MTYMTQNGHPVELMAISGTIGFGGSGPETAVQQGRHSIVAANAPRPTAVRRNLRCAAFWQQTAAALRTRWPLHSGNGSCRTAVVASRDSVAPKSDESRVQRVVECCGELWRVVDGCGGFWRPKEGSAGLWRVVEECRGLWRSAEGCGGVRTVGEGCGGVRRVVEEYGGLGRVEECGGLWRSNLRMAKRQVPLPKQ